ncbi:MAG TPA: hypothetical protein PLL77_15275 [Pyrinomonadaceae bacterium]|nr:hypothetical protein [Pyrinomonadaceae bacterium]
MTHTQDKMFSIGRGYGPDTMIVLFFLAIEYGRAVQAYSLDGLLMGITMAMICVLPYFLPSTAERPTFSNWILARGGFALMGMVFCVALNQGVGTILPESMRFMPMTFLILASMVSCYVQFYGLMKLRLAK